MRYYHMTVLMDIEVSDRKGERTYSWKKDEKIKVEGRIAYELGEGGFARFNDNLTAAEVGELLAGKVQYTHGKIESQ